MNPDKKEIELSFLTELKNRVNHDFNDESVIGSHIWSFLEDCETEILNNRIFKLSIKKRQENVENVAWVNIYKEYEVSKRDLSSKLRKMQSEDFNRQVILRDVAHAYLLEEYGFYKESVIISGSIIEELLRIYLKYKQINPRDNKFMSYLIACESNGLLKRAVHQLSDSIRNFRNFIHIQNEKSSRYTISRSTAKGAFSSIFTITNDIEL